MVFLHMKRDREAADLDNITAMANYLILMSRGAVGGGEFETYGGTNNNSLPSRVFECKTCNRQFPSFQALGGHRASHKKPRITGAGGDINQNQRQQQHSPVKPKTHECSICGLEFAIGQALGGHMRRHRAVATAAASNDSHSSPPHPATQPLFLLSPPTVHEAPIVKKSNSSRRVLCMDLNLTPLENDLEFQLGNVPRVVDCYL